MKMDEIKVRVPGGYLIANEAQDPDYPGIDVEFVSDENNDDLSRPRVLFEKPVDDKLRVLIWSDKDNEDYTHEITFD